MLGVQVDYNLSILFLTDHLWPSSLMVPLLVTCFCYHLWASPTFICFDPFSLGLFFGLTHLWNSFGDIENHHFSPTPPTSSFFNMFLVCTLFKISTYVQEFSAKLTFVPIKEELTKKLVFFNASHRQEPQVLPLDATLWIPSCPLGFCDVAWIII